MNKTFYLFDLPETLAIVIREKIENGVTIAIKNGDFETARNLIDNLENIKKVSDSEEVSE